MHWNRRARPVLVGLAIVVSSASVAASASKSGAATATKQAGSSSITLVGEPFGPFVRNYNPFSTSNAAYGEGTTSMVYEPLMQYNILRAGQIYPWLATSWAWSNGGKTLTLQIRKGVQWSDGKPFSAADVAFTFQLLKKYPALNVTGVDFASVSAPSPSTAVLTFSKAAYAQLFVVSQVLIVPQHLWSSVANPVTYADPDPVGTGPYLLQSYSAQQYTLAKNPNYWQKGLPKIDTVQVVDYVSNTSADLALEQGKLDWASLYIPHYQQLFVAKDPAHYHVWLPPTGNFFLCANTGRAPFDSVTVRQALSKAIDRDTVARDGEGGFYSSATSPTGLVLPNWAKYLDSKFASLKTSYDKAGVKTLLLKAGFKVGSNGMFVQPNGKPFKVAVEAPTPYTDFMTDTQLIVNEMRAAGIDASVKGVSLSAWTNDYTVGTYDVTFCGQWTTSGPYDLFASLLDSKRSAPVGKSAVGDFERWMDKATDASLAAYAGTNDAAVQLKAMHDIEATMVKDVPVIPLFYANAFGEYTTTHAVGWPTASNPYETPSASVPWDEVVVLHLRPAP